MGREERIVYDVVPTALGEALVAAAAEGVRAVYLGEDGADLERQVRERFPEAEVERDPGAVRERAAEVARRAEGLPPAVEVPLDLAGTPFQVAVWRALLDIPAGETRTYGDVARGIGHPSAQRAVGSACARNEISVLVPCHRVVPASGGRGGYRWEPARKGGLLEAERAAAGSQLGWAAREERGALVPRGRVHLDPQ